MRAAQKLYEGVNVPGEGQVGLITYMRTDSTHLSGEALKMARTYIEKTHGSSYLPEKPNFFGSTNKDAQEAHEAIRPTDAFRHPDQLDRSLGEDERRLYRLIWNRFVACQMTPAQWDSTTVLLERSDRPTGAVFKTNGRVLVFDGFYRVVRRADEQRRTDASRVHRTARDRAVRDQAGTALQFAAAAIHRSVAREDARTGRHRSPVDVCVDHSGDPESQLRRADRSPFPRHRARRSGDRQADRSVPARTRPRIHTRDGSGARQDRRRTSRLARDDRRVLRAVLASARARARDDDAREGGDDACAVQVSVVRRAYLLPLRQERALPLLRLRIPSATTPPRSIAKVAPCSRSA